LEAINNISKLKRINMVIGKVIDVKDCKRGYILKGIENHRVYKENGKTIKGHYIVFYDHLDGYDFQGAMITSKDYNNCNESLKEEHFFDKSITGEVYLVAYNNSYLVKAKLHKFHQMGDFIFVGLLTEEGVSFLEEVIDDMELVTWEQHCANNN
jgi:hypothetical protein